MDKMAETMISVEQITESEDTKGASLPEEEQTTDAAAMQDDTTQTEGLDNTAADEAEGQNQEEAGNQKVEGQTQKVYLTFDDGPSSNTAAILDTLAQYNVKATFFVVGKEDEESQEMYKRIVNEGHTLGMHSYSHKYSVIYDSLENFEDDFTKIQNYLYDITGEDCHYYRFPGGSSNQVSNTDMKEFIKYLNDQDVTYFDWNVTSGDATSQAYTADELVDNVLEDVVKYKTSVVLLHDANTKETTVEALGPMIEALQAQGVELLPITEDTTVIQHISADSVQ